MRSYNEGDVREVQDPEDISELVGREGRLLWVDMLDPTPEDFACIQDEFELHPLAMEDAMKHGQRPKLERYPSHAFVVAYSKEHAEVDLFVGEDWLVSVRARNDVGETWDIDGVRRRFERTRPESATVGFLLYNILDELVDGYFTAADAVEDKLEHLEDEIFLARPSEHEIQRELFDVRRDLLLFRRRVAPLREVVASLLRKEVPWIDDGALLQMNDVYDHVLRATDQIDAQRELMGNAVDAHLAIMSNRMNEVMKKMTSWGAIVLGATLVAGIYGMNFDHMPELGWRLGYPFALGIMVLITVGGYSYFKRRDWL